MGGYSVLYAAKGVEIISYFVFTRSKDRIVSGSTNRDFYTIFYWTYPQHRGKGYATTLVDYFINHLSLDFEALYKTIAKNNIPSIKVTEKSGFERVGSAKKEGHLHRISLADEGDIWLYKLQKK